MPSSLARPALVVFGHMLDLSIFVAIINLGLDQSGYYGALKYFLALPLIG